MSINSVNATPVQPETHLVIDADPAIQQAARSSGSPVQNDLVFLDAGTLQDATSSTSGAREACASGADDGYANIEAELAKRLKHDPAYKDLKSRSDECDTLIGDFELVERECSVVSFGRNDGILSTDDLNRAIEDHPNTPLARAAQRLLDNPELLAALMKGGRQCTKADVLAYVQGVRSELKSVESKVYQEVVSGIEGKKAAAANGAPTTAEASSAQSAPPSPEAVTAGVAKPEPSKLPGIEGASENLANGVDYLQNQITALMNEAAKDPSKAAALNAKIGILTQQMQIMVQMQNQLAQMMSNLAKVWSDIAMHNIGNMR